MGTTVLDLGVGEGVTLVSKQGSSKSLI